MQNEMEKAVIWCEQYCLKPQYKFLYIPEETLFKMTTEQWLKHMKKFNSCQVCTHTAIADTTTKKDDQQLSNQHSSTISIRSG